MCIRIANPDACLRLVLDVGKLFEELLPYRVGADVVVFVQFIEFEVFLTCVLHVTTEITSW